MNKEIDRSQIGPTEWSRLRKRKEETPKKIKIYDSLDEAISDFDKPDTEIDTEYIVGPEVRIPPIPTDTEVTEYLLKNALLLIDAGEYPLARKILTEVLKRDLNRTDALRWLGWCFKQEGDFKSAENCYEQLIQKRVTDQDLFELGEIYYALKRDEQAQLAWQDALGQADAESPRLFDIHKNLGNVFTRNNDFEGAEENYHKALIIQPYSDVLHVNMGSLNYQRKNHKAALESFKKAAQLNPYNDRAWCGISLVARELNDFTWAQGSLSRALDINPYNLTALQLVVNWALTDQVWEEAIFRVEKYLEKNNRDLDLTYTLAGLHFQKGDLDSTDASLKRILELDSNRKDAIELKDLVEKKRSHGS